MADLPLDQIILGDNCERSSRVRDELNCRDCGAVWKHANGKTIATCPFCGKLKDARIRAYKETEAQRTGFVRLIGDKDVRAKYGKRSRERLRRKVLFRICGTNKFQCVRCGCDDERFLEINHKNGGGALEFKRSNSSQKFYRDIANGVRKVDDLELLCKPCNSIHALELRFGNVNLEVKWNG